MVVAQSEEQWFDSQCPTEPKLVPDSLACIGLWLCVCETKKYFVH